MNNQNALIAAMEDGLNVREPRPYRTMALQVGRTEEDVIRDIVELKKAGKIKRFGLVVKNRNVGYIHNAMVTMDIPESQVDQLGTKIAAYPWVKLCYQRQRVLPQWPYNLYFMIHGKSRELVLEQIEQMKKELELQNVKLEVLFSVKCFKQKGASYF